MLSKVRAFFSGGI